MLVVAHEMSVSRDGSINVAFPHKGFVEAEGPRTEMLGDIRSELFRQFIAKNKDWAAVTCRSSQPDRP